MKKRYAALLASTLMLAGACNMDKFLDVNTNPNAPQAVTANLYLPPMEHWLATSIQYDGQYIGQYTQQWVLPQAATASFPGVWARMGYATSSDASAEQWRDVYWSFGQGLSD